MQHHATELHVPTDALARHAHIRGSEYKAMYASSLTSPDTFWKEQAAQLHWEKAWSGPVCNVVNHLLITLVTAQWCEGAKTNLCYNALDRHVAAGHGDRVAFLWEGNDIGQQRSVTYHELLDEVCRIGSWLTSLGCDAGSDVTIYMPMVPELPAAMLACARIGAVHSVVFGGFSAEALSGRIIDSKAKVVITASAAKRGAKLIGLKKIVDEALELCQRAGHAVETVLVYDHALALPERSATVMKAGRDVWWQEAVGRQPTGACPVVWMDAEAPLFKLYTSGSTGQPKGVLHTTAGYMVGATLTFKYVFDYHSDDVYWCTADCGWITGHSYVTYGPLISCATQVLYEGVPTYPEADRCWQIIDKHKVTIFYTAPTAIRALQSLGDSHVVKHSRASLRLLGSVGEPINPEAWNWYYEVVGGSRCPIMDTWWQTETGSHMITPLPGVTALKPGSATLPFFGVEPAVLDDKGNELEGECQGILVIKRPVPSMMRTLAGDHDRFEQTYFSAFPGYYFTGDGCRRDADGYYWIIGRVDDVINVSGHRIGTAEVESALVEHPECVEAAVVAQDHPIKGQCIYAYVTLMEGHSYPPERAELRAELIATVRKIIGAIATPDTVHWAPALPKTRSGKIMRRILRKIAAGEEDQLGDTSTLADPNVVTALIQLRGK